jgi:hypothetical protein
VAEVGVGEELECSSAGAAFEIMLNLAGGPIIAEEVLQGTGALGEAQFAIVYGVEKAASEFEIFTRLIEAEALHEPVALRACRHWTSVPSSRSAGSHADGVSVMLTLRHGTVIWSVAQGSDWREEMLFSGASLGEEVSE